MFEQIQMAYGMPIPQVPFPYFYQTAKLSQNLSSTSHSLSELAANSRERSNSEDKCSDRKASASSNGSPTSVNCTSLKDGCCNELENKSTSGWS